MKRIMRGKTKKRIKDIKCNRPGWSKKVIRREGTIKFKRKGKKIKSKEWRKL